MPLTHKTKWHHVNDAKISKMLTDPESGAATYASSIDVPGIKTLGVGGAVNSGALRGDNQLLDFFTILTAITISFQHAKVSLDVLGCMMGATVVDSGVTPAMKAKLPILGNQTFSYWKIEAQTTGVDTGIGDGHIVVPKCILSDMPDLGFAEEDYRILSGKANAIPRTSDNSWIDIEMNETAVAIA